MARYENMHGQCVLAGHTFAAADIKPGSLWIPADGSLRRIRVDKVDVATGDVYYTDLGNSRRLERDTFGFQCRYCLVVNDVKDFAHLLDEGSTALTD